MIPLLKLPPLDKSYKTGDNVKMKNCVSTDGPQTIIGYMKKMQSIAANNRIVASSMAAILTRENASYKRIKDFEQMRFKK